MVDEELLRQRLLARDDHAARVAAGVRDAQELEQAHDVVVEQDVAVKLLEQVEHDVRLELLDGVADGQQLILDA